MSVSARDACLRPYIDSGEVCQCWLPRDHADDCPTANGHETMLLADLLRDYRDGDEHGWETEFTYLREHHGPKLDALATSVQEVGMLEPVLLGSDGRVWDGHHRLCVASMLALESVPVERAFSMDG